MIKNIIFDMDGTLLNTIDDLTDSLNYALSKLNYPTHSAEIVKGFVGNGITKLIERATPPGITAEERAECLGIFSKHYDGNKNNKTAPYDGILPMLKDLSDRSINMAVVSNKYDTAVRALTAELFGEYITVAIGESEEVKPKPCPDGVLLAMNRLGATAKDSVYIGDSDVDYATAKNSGLPFIGVTWGFRSRKFLESLGAELLADTPNEIIELINKI